MTHLARRYLPPRLKLIIQQWILTEQLIFNRYFAQNFPGYNDNFPQCGMSSQACRFVKNGLRLLCLRVHALCNCESLPEIVHKIGNNGPGLGSGSELNLRKSFGIMIEDLENTRHSSDNFFWFHGFIPPIRKVTEPEYQYACDTGSKNQSLDLSSNDLTYVCRSVQLYGP